MNLRQPFSLAAKSLLANKLRSILTMLGVIIGVAAVIALVGIMSGFKQFFIDSFSSVGMNNISVSFYESTDDISFDEINQLIENNNDILSAFSPTIQSVGSVKEYTDDTNVTVYGVNEMYKQLNNINIKYGEFLSYMDIRDKTYNCVIGSYVSSKLFFDNPVGETICINGKNFEIVGVAEQRADNSEKSLDNAVYMPYNVLQTIMYSTQITDISFLSADKEKITDAKRILEDYFYSKYQNEDSYYVMSMVEMLDAVNQVLDVFQWILVGIASISLLVGGIGIMNIMIVSVTERVKEIGIRKALGATPWDILSQFVVEAITTSIIGGIIGIAIGLEITYTVSKLAKMPFSISIEIILIAVSVSTLIGVIFGFVPAKKAAALDPVDALRHE